MQGLKYTVDVVMCIDCTGSMADIMNTVKAHALHFYPDLKKALDEKDKHVEALRIKIIGFRDFYADGDEAMRESPFYNIPEQQDELQTFVNGLEPKGGGDEPENGLEALALAIRSPWNSTGDKKRQIIVVYTDASAHPLEKSGSKPGNYPGDIPRTFSDLSSWWSGQDSLISQSAQRLIIYAPDTMPWSDISNVWENTIHYPSQAGTGLKDLDYETILAAIVKSI